MALTVIERKILEAARLLIQDSKQMFICYAIDMVPMPKGRRQEYSEAKIRLRNYISSKLKGHGTLGNYLLKTYRRGYMSVDLQRKARIAWITWMLGEPVEVDVQTQRQFAIYMNPLLDVML
jgi:hypothetical protein